MRSKNVLLVAFLSGLVCLSQPVLADTEESRDEKLLRQAGIGTDWDSLRAFMRPTSDRTTDPERIQKLIRQFGSKDFQEREEASKELMTCGPVALAPLLTAMRSDDPEVASRARSCFDEISRRSSAPVFAAVTRRMVQLRPAEAVPALLETLGHPDAEFRRMALGELGPLIGPKHLPDVLKAIRDKNPNVRAGAILLSFAYKEQPKDWVPLLLEAIRDENVLIRRNAATALRHFGNEEGVVAALIEALKDKDATPLSMASVPRRAASSLETFGTLARPAIPGLMTLSKDGDELNRTVATSALGHLAGTDKEIIPRVVPFLIQLLEDKNQPVGNRKAAATALGLVGPDAKAGVSALREVLRCQDVKEPGNPYGIHNSVLSALVRIGPGAEAAVLDITAVLQDKERTARDRQLAAEALGAIGSGAKPAVPALAMTLKDEVYDLKLAAIKALGAIGPAAEPAVPALVEALKDNYASINEAAAKALGTVGPAAKAAVPALTEALKHGPPNVREAAAEALKRIEPKPE